MARYCSKCGAQIGENARFCPKCGTRMEEPAPGRRTAEPGAGEPVRRADERPIQRGNVREEGRAESAASPHGHRRKKRGSGMALGILAAVLAVGAVGGGLYYKTAQSEPAVKNESGAGWDENKAGEGDSAGGNPGLSGGAAEQANNAAEQANGAAGQNAGGTGQEGAAGAAAAGGELSGGTLGQTASGAGYEMSVMQYDFTDYPTVRLYLDIRDKATGGVVEELSPNMFTVSERDAATGNFLNRAVKKAVRLNENERLNINLLADTSGSMDGGSMDAAKEVMKHFLGTVQFDAGDQVKMTPFNSVIEKDGSFSGDLTFLNHLIDGYYAYGQTKLYDAIVYGVQDVSGQEGARCVIAFTDGMDMGSYYSPEEVADLVSRYHIPVFIVRIGDDSTAEEDDSLQMIAEASGGSFRNLAQFNEDMSDFYGQVYRQMKEYYVVEYEADGDDSAAKEREISVCVQNGTQTGEASATANPGNELFDSLLGGFLRSYIIDMNHHEYSELTQYVDSAVAADDTDSIQWQMKKQVTGGFSNVSAESLMDYRVVDVTFVDENTVRLKGNENYEVQYDEVYGDLKNSERTVAQDALAYLESEGSLSGLSDSTRIRIWAKVNQIPTYILKKGSDGSWKFSRYDGKMEIGERRQVYDVEVIR